MTPIKHMNQQRWTSLAVLVILCAAGAVATRAQQIHAQDALVSVERIWDRAPHNAFTDLISFRGKLYCAFREGPAHVPTFDGANGTVRIIASADAQNWSSVALLEEVGVDLRDPKLSVTPDGRLMVLIGGSTYEGNKLIKFSPRVSFSDRAGAKFSAPVPAALDARIRTERDWLWRVTWDRGTGYGVVYQMDATQVSKAAEIRCHLVATTDGINYRQIAAFAVTGKPNETTVRVTPDGEMVALVRREAGSKNGYVGTSRAPYRDWAWKELNARLGGPNFVALPSGKLLAATRGYLADDAYDTHLARLTTDGRLTRILALPSGGDTSYPGLLVRGDKLFVSYYSSHEGRSAIYLATLRLKPLL